MSNRWESQNMIVNIVSQTATVAIYQAAVKLAHAH